MPQLFRDSLVGDRWTVRRVVKKQPCQVCRVTDVSGAGGYLKYQEDPENYSYPTYGRKRFLREIDFMRALEGEAGVLPMLDFDTTDDPHWFVTEEAKLLAEHFGAEPDFREVVKAFAHLAETLARISRALDITHRDLKPDNLFWLDGEAVVGDFGIAKDEAELQAKLTDGWAQAWSVGVHRTRGSRQ